MTGDEFGCGDGRGGLSCPLPLPPLPGAPGWCQWRNGDAVPDAG